MSDQKKLRVIGLMLTTGFICGLFLQHKAARAFPPAVAPHADNVALAHASPPPVQAAPAAAAAPIAPAPVQTASLTTEAKTENTKPATEIARRDDATTPAPETPANPSPLKLTLDELTPEVLRRYAAVSVLVGNTLEIESSTGDKRSLYFAPRGVAGETSGDHMVARLWTRDDDRLCQSLAGDRRECFYVSLRLDESLRDGPIDQLSARVAALPEGAKIGEVSGFGNAKAVLIHGNAVKLPDFVPLLETRPDDAWLKPDSAEDSSFVGTLLLRESSDDDRAVTFFAATGQVFQATRIGRHAVDLRIGAWRRDRDLICRGQEGVAPECSHLRLTEDGVEFPEAANEQRRFIRQPWPDDEAGKARLGARDRSSAVTLTPALKRRNDDGLADLR